MTDLILAYVTPDPYIHCVALFCPQRHAMIVSLGW